MIRVRNVFSKAIAIVSFPEKTANGLRNLFSTYANSSRPHFVALSARQVVHKTSFSTSTLGKAPSGLAPVNGVNIYYEKAGSSPEAILCMPGALGTCQTDFAPQLKGLSDCFTVVAFDPRGFGASRPPKREFPLDFYHIDANDGAAVMHHLGFNQFHVMGWSDGGISALILAGTKPKTVRKMIVWGAQAYLTETDIAMIERSRDLSKWSEKMRAPLEAIYGKEGLAEIWSAWLDGFFQFQHQPNWNICREVLPHISCPSFVVHGKKDPLVPGTHAQYLLDNIKNVEYYEFENGKHNIHLRYHQEFNEIVKKFLKKD